MTRFSPSGLAYETRGRGKPLLALHGFYPDSRLMVGCLEPLFGADDRARISPTAIGGRPQGGPSLSPWERYYLDLPFMGESPDPAEVASSDDMLAAVLTFIKEVLPPGPFALAGESYGGYLARAIARALPERVAGILFICPLIVPEASARNLPRHEASPEGPGYGIGIGAEELEEFESVAVVRDSYCLERALREVIPGVRAARSDALERLREKAYAFSFDHLGRAGAADEVFDPVFRKPCLFFLGRKDASTGWMDALRLAERYPSASYAILDGGGHNLQIEAAGDLATLAGEWLARVEADQGLCEGA